MTPISSVLISEVGPRDGLQSMKATMPTAAKLRWIDERAGAARMHNTRGLGLANCLAAFEAGVPKRFVQGAVNV